LTFASLLDGYQVVVGFRGTTIRTLRNIIPRTISLLHP